MLPSDSTIYAVCIPGEKVRYEARSHIAPIMGGACHLKDHERAWLRSEGYQFDDEDAFLSPLNSQWGELTCIHWMINNAKEPNIGNAQYRRNWVEPNDQWYEEDVLYVPEAAEFGCSLEQQFYGGHRDFDAPAICRELAATGNWLFSTEENEAIWAQNRFIGCNMARGSNQNYKQFMTVLFNALLPIWNKHEKHFMKIKGYDKRALAFISERIITGIVLYRDKILPGINIATAPIGFIP